MRLKLFALFALICPLVALAEAQRYDGIAAYVNDKVITIDTVLKEELMSFDWQRVPMNQRMNKMRELFPVTRDLLIDRILILKAYEDSGASLPNDVVNERMQNFIAERFDGDEAKLRESLRASRTTYAEWAKNFREQLLVQAMRQLQVNKKISVSPKQVKAYFAEHQQEFAVGAKARVRTILLTPAQGKAVQDEVMEALKTHPFEDVARQFSSDSQASKGGDWGLVEVDKTFSPAMAEATAKLKVGETSDWVEMNGYRTLILKEAEEGGTTPSLADVYAEVEARLHEEVALKRYEAWLEALRKEAYIKIMPVEL